MRVKAAYVPGRRGCELRGKVCFAIDPDERVAQQRHDQGTAPKRGMT